MGCLLIDGLIDAKIICPFKYGLVHKGCLHKIGKKLTPVCFCLFWALLSFSFPSVDVHNDIGDGILLVTY